MAVIETWLKTDLKSIVRVHAIHGNVFGQDNMANLIGVELLDGGEPATVTGSVSANVLRADGTTVAVDGTLSGNKASITLPQAAYAVPGMLAVVIKLTADSVVTTIGAVQAIVYRSSTDTIIDPGTVIPSVQNLIAAIDTALASIPQDYSALDNALNAASFTLTTNTSATGLIKDVDFPVFAGEKYFIRYKRPSIGTVTSMRLYGKSGGSWVSLVSTDFVDEGFGYTFSSDYSQLRFWLSCSGLSAGVTTDVLIIRRDANSVGEMVLSAVDDQDLDDVRVMSGAETQSGFVNGSLNGNSGAEIVISDGTRLRTGYLRSYPGATQTISVDNTEGGITDAWALFYGDRDTTTYISSRTLSVSTGIFTDDIIIPAGANYLRVRLDGSGLVAADYSCTLRFTGENGERLDNIEDDITGIRTDLSSANANAVANRGNIGTADLNLNGGDFIKPGRWAISNMAYEPKFYPTDQPGTVISFASTTENPFGTYQIVADQAGNVYRRYGGGLNNWYSWSHDIPFHHDLAFVPAFTQLEPLVNSYTINRDTSETGRVANLYALYDAVTDSEVKITKDTIGQSATPAGNTSEVYTIYNYKVSLKNNTTEKPAVLLVVGEHGDELNSAMVGYYTFREIVTGCLKKYLTYVDFWVVPLMNPYGYEHKQRNNANDVNLNRDFPCEWAYSDTEHNKTGNYSLSQPESLLLYNLLVNNKDKILFMCNKHNTGDIATKISNNFDGILGYVSTVMQQDKIANNGIAGYQNKQVRTTDPWVAADYTGDKDLNAMRFIASRSILTPGTLDLFANSIGIHGSLLEVDGSAGVPIYGSTRYTDCARFELDFFVNWIAASIEQNHIMLSNDNVTQKLHYYTQRQVDGSWVLTEQYWNGSELTDV